MTRGRRHAARLAPALLLAAVACLGPAHGVLPEWQATVVWTAPAELRACAAGDLLPGAPGDEVVVATVDGAIHALHRPLRGQSATGWLHLLLARVPGEPLRCAVGDVDPSHPGDEVLVVGIARGADGEPGGAAWLLVDEGGPERTVVPLLRTDGPIEAACVADVDPSRPGPEAVVAGSDRRVHVLSFDGAGFLEQVACTLGAAPRDLCGWQGGIAAACADGAVVLARVTDGRWDSTVVARAPVAVTRLSADGPLLLVARDDGVPWLLDTGGAARELPRAAGALRGVVLADLDPDHPGPEVATADASGAVVVQAELADGTWVAARAYTAPGDTADLASGELDTVGIGNELVCAVSAGDVVLVRRAKVRR